MTQRDNPVLPEAVRQILDGRHLSARAVTNPDGQAQTSVICGDIVAVLIGDREEPI